MKTESKKLDGSKAEVKVALDVQEVASAVKEVEKEFVRQVRLPGFRPGKVPLDRIRREFSSDLANGIRERLVGKAVRKISEEKPVKFVAAVDLKDFERNDEGATFTVVCDVEPEFKLPKYKGFKISSNDTSVSDKDVEDMLARLRENFATYEDAKEGDAAQDHDFVQIDYSGTVDGKPILEIAPDAKIVASGTGFWLRLEEGMFLAEILEAVKGMRVGETKEGVSAHFSDETAPEALKGANAVYTVTVKAIRHRVLPDDATFAARMKEDTVDAVAKNVREKMARRNVEAETNRRENEAVELLLKAAGDFDVPQTMVDRMKQYQLSDMAESYKRAGVSAEWVQSNSEKIVKDAEEQALRLTRFSYICKAVAEAEGMELKDDINSRVVELVLANAKA